jgi:hypothetical protein
VGVIAITAGVTGNDQTIAARGVRERAPGARGYRTGINNG